jgi:thiol-disulfide isomerase/thioredoxin
MSSDVQSVTRRGVLVASIAAAAALAFRTAAGQEPEPVASPIASPDPNPGVPLPVRGLSVAAAERRTVLYFYASWCVLSKRANTFQSNLARAYRNVVNYQKIDIDTLEGEAWVKLYQVPFVPVFVVLDPDGKLIEMFYSPAQMSQNARALSA